MGGAGNVEVHIAAIYNSAWWVRHWCRPGQAGQRAEAIRSLGLVVREAFNKSEDFEPLLVALCDSLNKRDDQKPF